MTDDGGFLCTFDNKEKACQQSRPSHCSHSPHNHTKLIMVKERKEKKEKKADKADKAAKVEKAEKAEKAEKKAEKKAVAGDDSDMEVDAPTRTLDLSPIAAPLAADKLTKKLLKTVKKGNPFTLTSGEEDFAKTWSSEHVLV